MNVSSYKSRSVYTYEIKNIRGRNIISIIDMNLRMTVTNNIDNVIKEITERENIIPLNFMVVYRDTNNIWDGWDVWRRAFVALQEDTEDRAVAKYIRMQLLIKT